MPYLWTSLSLIKRVGRIRHSDDPRQIKVRRKSWQSVHRDPFESALVNESVSAARIKPSESPQIFWTEEFGGEGEGENASTWGGSVIVDRAPMLLRLHDSRLSYKLFTTHEEKNLCRGGNSGFDENTEQDPIPPHGITNAVQIHEITLINSPSARALLEVVSRSSGVGDTTTERTVIADRGGMSTEVITERDGDHVLIYDAVRASVPSAIGAATRKDGVFIISRSAAHEVVALVVVVLMRIAGKEYIRDHETWRDR